MKTALLFALAGLILLALARALYLAWITPTQTPQEPKSPNIQLRPPAYYANQKRRRQNRAHRQRLRRQIKESRKNNRP